MTDIDLVEKKLADIETLLVQLRTLVDIDSIERDVKEERFAAHTLQLAIQNALDVCSQIISDERLGEPVTNQELFSILERHGWLSADLAPKLRNMAGFRNILVHAYDRLDLDVMVDVLRHRLPDLEGFVQAIRRRLHLQRTG